MSGSETSRSIVIPGGGQRAGRRSSVSYQRGGKSVGNRFVSTSSAATKAAAEQGKKVQRPFDNESGFASVSSDNDSLDEGAAGEHSLSVTATREELRDRSARLASMTLSPAHLPNDAVSPRFDAKLSKSPQALPSSSPNGPSSGPSNLTRARPPPAPGPAVSATSIESVLSLPSPTLAPSAGSDSPTDNERTPTQSNVGSLAVSPTLQSNSPFKASSKGDLRKRNKSESRRRSSVLDSLPDEPRNASKKMPVEMGDEVLEDYPEEEEAEEHDSDQQHFHKPADERTSLLGGRKRREWSAKWWATAKRKLSPLKDPDNLREAYTFAWLPPVILGTILNILDGISYGYVMFGTSGQFKDFGGIGVSMFFVTCVVSQLVYTLGGSIFKGGNGSMMIEVVPFYHVIVTIVSNTVRHDDEVVPTVMVAFALASVLTGIAFWVLGFFKLGQLCEFFPRHILVGCIGGVGAFLFITGLQVSARLEEEVTFSLDLLRQFFESSTWPLWVVPLALAIILRLITARYSHPLIFPAYFIMIPVIFYIVVAIFRLNLTDLRKQGWVFDVEGVDSEWYEYFTLFDFRKTDFEAIVDTIPTQLALVFFGLLHVPINVPALGISVGEDNVDTDRELVAHGISNVAAGLLGTTPNYLCYVNSVLFYKVGGTTRFSSFMLAVASFGVLLAGPAVIGYLPVCVVGALIFILGIDLVKEAVWDTFGRVANFEYVTIWAIVIVMTLYDFVVGIGVGIIMACVSFVVLSSQRRVVRAILSGSVARSTVRRHPKQLAFLKEVGSQTRVIKLQGFLFFGTISACETTIRKILDRASWEHNPIRFLVLDFAMVAGVDFSAAEAFVRIQRLLSERDVLLILCGCPYDSNVGKALRSVNLWADEEKGVQVFENLNDALEHCENGFLRSLYAKDFRTPDLSASIGPVLTSQIDVPKAELDSDVEIFEQSPRASHLRHAAKATITHASESTAQARTNFSQPIPLLLQAFLPFFASMDEDYCFRLSKYFKRVYVERGTTIWNVNDESDSTYVIESGMLRASYLFLDRKHLVCESMVAGTIAGEMTFLSRIPRTTDVVAERDSVLWQMDVANHERMAKEEGWKFCRTFEQCLLRISQEEQEVLMGHLISVL